MQKRLLTLTAVSTLLLSGCVSSMKYKDLIEITQEYASELENQKVSNADLTTKYEVLNTRYSVSEENLLKSKAENIALETEKKKLEAQNKDLSAQYIESNQKYQELLLSKGKDLDKVSNDLFEARQDLEKKLAELTEKEKHFAQLQTQFAEKEQRANELQKALEAKDKEVKVIHEKISQALLGFQDKGLSVYTKDGKVYVSMDEKLLFSSGSWSVNKEGVNALKEIALVLQLNPDINVMVEGHTDNIPLSGKSQIKDNWDLSVMRATSITKILLTEGNIEPERITPSGRGQYLPIESNASAEGRAKNRRTEIILTPKVDELLKLID